MTAAPARRAVAVAEPIAGVMEKGRAPIPRRDPLEEAYGAPAATACRARSIT
jgi:hypothetical protein